MSFRPAGLHSELQPGLHRNLVSEEQGRGGEEEGEEEKKNNNNNDNQA